MINCEADELLARAWFTNKTLLEFREWHVVTKDLHLVVLKITTANRSECTPGNAIFQAPDSESKNHPMEKNLVRFS